MYALTSLQRSAAATTRLLVVTLAVWALAPASNALAQMGPDYWRVKGVPANDYLNIRSGPSTRNQVIARAPNGAVFRNLGCEGTGSGRWCHLETPRGDVNGWASGRFLEESSAPGGGNISGSNDVPELHVRNTGEIEVRFASGCTVLYNPMGRRITAGSSCSSTQLTRAHAAADGYLREQAGSDFHEGGGGQASGTVNMSGTGTIIGGGVLTGNVSGHREGHYALSMIGNGLTCTGLVKHAPGTVGSESTNIHCSNGAHGLAVIATRSNGTLLTFNLSDGTGGFINF